MPEQKEGHIQGARFKHGDDFFLGNKSYKIVKRLIVGRDVFATFSVKSYYRRAVSNSLYT